MNQSSTIDRDRLSVITGALVLALALARFLEIPQRPLATSLFGSQVTVNLSATTVAILLISGMAVAGAESLIGSHPLARLGGQKRNFMFWIVPGLLALSLASWLGEVETLGLWTAGLILSSILIPLALATEYAGVDPQRRQGTTLQWWLTALIYLVIIMLFVRIYDLRARALLSGTAVLLVSLLLAARIFWMTTNDTISAFIYGAVTALYLGLMTWVLNYWALSSLQGGLLLFLFFYAVTGLIQQYLNGRFGRQVVLEYVGVATLGLVGVILGVG